jgi:transporter family-2 protein
VVTLALVVAFLGGVAIAFQSPLASLMSQRIGWVESTFLIHLGGALVIGLPLVFLAGGRLSEWRTVPPYALGAGVLGIALIASVSYAIPRIGLTSTIAAIICAQLAIGALLDHFGLLGMAVRPFGWSRATGLAILFLGTWMVTK